MKKAQGRIVSCSKEDYINNKFKCSSERENRNNDNRTVCSGTGKKHAPGREKKWSRKWQTTVMAMNAALRRHCRPVYTLQPAPASQDYRRLGERLPVMTSKQLLMALLLYTAISSPSNRKSIDPKRLPGPSTQARQCSQSIG